MTQESLHPAKLSVTLTEAAHAPTPLFSSFLFILLHYSHLTLKLLLPSNSDYLIYIEKKEAGPFHYLQYNNN